MKKLIITALLSSAMLLVSAESSAQRTSYPARNKAFLDATDAAASTTYNKRPLIGVPPQGSSEECRSILDAGGIPVAVSLQSTDFGVMRDLAAQLDGFVFTQAFLSELDTDAAAGGNSAVMLLTKALMDRNVPMLGSSSTIAEWNKGMMRLESGVSNIPELVAKARTYRHAKELMSGILTVDSHCDLPGRYERGYSVGKRNACQGAVPKMDEGCLSSEVIIAFVDPETAEKEGAAACIAEAERELDKAKADIAANSSCCGIARSHEEALALKSEGKKAYFLGLENASGLGGDIRNVKRFRDEGVIYFTLSHMHDNDVCQSSTKTSDASKGLTAFGVEVVREMNRLGVIIDCSHTSEGTFWDVIRESKVPFLCTHSGANAVWNHNRNISDRQLKALADKGGVIQVYILQGFMGKKGEVSIETFMDHLNHCVEVAGIDHVGVGSDFDGGGGGWGLNGANDHINITVKMIEHGYSDSDIAKLWGGNFFRVMDEVQAYADKQQ